MKRQHFILSSIMALLVLSTYGCDKGDAIGGCSSNEDCASTVLFACDLSRGVCVEKQTCSNETKDGSESDVDCGGICEKCDNGKECSKNSDCKSGLCEDDECVNKGCEDDEDCDDGDAHSCNDNGYCNTCSDEKKNGTETDVDCGGPCEKKCAAGKQCKKNKDCASGSCNDGVCESVSCSKDADCGSNGLCDDGTCLSCEDGEKNGDETDIDCGGSDICCEGSVCKTCANGKSCKSDSDCTSGKCESNKCVSGSEPPTGETCSDGKENGDETDVDCGGSCSKCETGKSCAKDADCKTGNCEGNTCKEAATVDPCTNGSKDTGEADVDCGGSCSTKCANGKTCTQASDCTSGNCDNGKCQEVKVDTCKDGVKSGDESDVDCGGSCAKKCAQEQACNSDSDCDSYNCQGGLCKGNGCDSASAQQIIINEVMTNPDASKVMAHSNSKQMKYVELYNKTDKPLALNDLSLKAGDKEITIKGCIAAKTYLVVSNETPKALDLDAKTLTASVNEAVDSNTKNMTLTKRNGGEKIHAVTIPATSSGVSAGRSADPASSALDETMIPHSEITPEKSAPKVACSPGVANNAGEPQG